MKLNAIMKKWKNNLKKLANSDETNEKSDPEEKYKNIKIELGIGDPDRRMIHDDLYNKKSKKYNEVNNESDKLMLNNPDEAKRYNEEMKNNRFLFIFSNINKCQKVNMNI